MTDLRVQRPVDETPQLLIETKLRPPKARGEFVARPALSQRLDQAGSHQLTFISAPTGYGKTTLLSSWAHQSRVPVAWLTLEASESDPARFLQYIVGALLRSGVSLTPATTVSVSAPGADLAGAVLTSLINDLAAMPDPVVLVLDDYHLVTDERCHELMTSLIRGKPDQLRIVIATRRDPPLPLGRWRATGELMELRQAQLRFEADETDRFLNGALDLQLDLSTLSALNERTEGWPAGLYLAALGMRARDDRAGFVAEFAGSHRHVVDYLGPEMLAPLDADSRDFLLRSSILDRLSGPLCDAVLGTTGSAVRLRALHQGNLFLTALDDDGTWYRHHRLFAELLRSLLVNEAPDIIPTLHARAADWSAANGLLESTVRHALLAGRAEQACMAVASNWRHLTRIGRFETLQTLLDSLGSDRGALAGPLAVVEAINLGLQGEDQARIDGLITSAERAGWSGPTPDGMEEFALLVALARSTLIGTDLGRALSAARVLVGRQAAMPVVDGVGRANLGMALIVAGEPDAALAALVPFGEYPDAPMVDVYGLAARALAMTLTGDPMGGERAAGHALVRARGWGLESSTVGGAVALAMGVALARQDRAAEAEPYLGRALETWGRAAGTLPRAYVLLSLAPVTATTGHDDDARTMAREARAILAACPSAGTLPQVLEHVERLLRIRPRRDLVEADVPTEAELRVLRLMAGDLSRAAIAGDLFLSPNTVKSHIKSINRKLGTTSRDEAVVRARALGLI